jgi:CxxC-x17-CxxC domain-containing protein
LFSSCFLRLKSIIFTNNHNNLPSITGKNIHNFMGNFQGSGGNRGGGFRSGNGGGRSNYRGDRGEVTMYKAICDECHKSCEVPFRPSGDKPVYCNECFSKKRGNDDRGPRKDFTDHGPKREFNDRPLPPPFSKPIGAPNDMTKQLGDISAKLDRLMAAIEKLPQPKETKPVINAFPIVAKSEIKKAPVAKVPAKKVVTRKKTK